MKTENLKTIIRQLDLVVSNDTTRPSLQKVRIKNIGGSTFKLSACDGHILSQIVIDEPAFVGLDTTYINSDMAPILKAIVKLNKYGIENVSITENSIVIAGMTVTEFESRFPAIESVIPKYEKTVSIGIDAELLLSLVKGLSDSKKMQCRLDVKLEETENGIELAKLNAILVKANGSNSNDSFGVIMPVRV